MIRSLFPMVFGFLLATGYGADGINPGVPWPATDALGRELPMTAEVGLPKKDRFVGIFYLPWTGDEFSYGPYDISKILADQPDMRTTPTFRHTGGLCLQNYLRGIWNLDRTWEELNRCYRQSRARGRSV